MKYFLLLLKIIFPLSIVLIIFQFVAFDIGWYKKEFVKYGVFEQLGEERVINQTDNLFQYLKGTSSLEGKYYSQKEVLHLQDVKKILFLTHLTTWVFFIFYLFFSGVIATKEGMKKYLHYSYRCFIINAFAYVILVIISLAFFNRIFYIFHTLIFSNDYWLLDPQKELLVIIFPQDIFLDLFIKIIFYSFVISIAGAVAIKIFVLKKSQIKI